MANVNISIKNCNNIKEGTISIEENRLNVRYGMNGTGKSTLSKAIDLSSKGSGLESLAPFGNDIDTPSITISKMFNNVQVYNEEFVERMVFQESAVINNAFDVFIRTPDYEERRKELDNRLIKLKIDIDSQERIIQLRKDILAFYGKLELNAAKTSIKNGVNYKAIVKKNNVYNIPEKLKKYAEIISDEDICIDWIDWKTKGAGFDSKGICPYCADGLNDDYEEEKKTFKETYTKSDAKNLKAMLDLFENFHKYMNEDKFTSIIACVKEEKDEDTISTVMKAVLNEYEHISNKLNKISLFDKNAFKQIDISGIDELLKGMQFETSVFNYFSSNYFMEIVNDVNCKIEELRKEAKEIKIAIGKLQSILKQALNESQKDINNFLDSAGINYHIGINLDEDGQAFATLMYISENELVHVEHIKNHLSWGERNAFSLILFMFYAISVNADLIVLDDPISSFDANKKYAIIHRMFSKQTGLIKRELYRKTVLMLTHDFEPIIDFGVVGKLPSDALDIKFIRNRGGKLDEIEINCDNDVRPVLQEIVRNIKDETLGIVHRIAFLRKYYEYEGIETNIDAYNVLSSLIHGRPTYRYKNGDEITVDKVQKGTEDIKKWIDTFDYKKFIAEIYNEQSLALMYLTETNHYLKVQLFRALFEVVPQMEIKDDDVLVKFINESYHIENDYAYYLDVIKYEMIPEYIIRAIDKYMMEKYGHLLEENNCR